MVDAEPGEPGWCRASLEGVVDVAVPGLGGMAEEAVCEALRLQFFFLPQVVERCARDPTLVRDVLRLQFFFLPQVVERCVATLP